MWNISFKISWEMCSFPEPITFATLGVHLKLKTQRYLFDQFSFTILQLYCHNLLFIWSRRTLLRSHVAASIGDTFADGVKLIFTFFTKLYMQCVKNKSSPLLRMELVISGKFCHRHILIFSWLVLKIFALWRSIVIASTSVHLVSCSFLPVTKLLLNQKIKFLFSLLL